MRKLLSACCALLIALTVSAQGGNPWTARTGAEGLPRDKGATRATFPKSFRLFGLDQAALRSQLFAVVGNAQRHRTVISLPNADGVLEQFEVTEASNFEPALQARFPEIRAFSGRGVTDPYATLKLSYAPNGVQAMVFRTGKESEFLEAYSADHTVYAVFRRAQSDRASWRCDTPEDRVTDNLNRAVFGSTATARSGGDIKTMRLAQSVTGEYSNYFGATSAAQVNLVLAAINATLTRCNGVYEKDLALHLNLINATTDVIYYDPASDPYANAATGAGGTWNGQLQSTLTSVIGEANYDIGHLFGASGGGGNAGCIGCICVNGSKGKGFTSPADAIPQGDNFDIDYVVHEVGHQLGANHTFSMTNEGSGQNKEPGSGITIMGYAGITSYDIAPHSIDIYHATSIAQIQTNLAAKTCPVTTAIVNATPVVAPVTAHTIPISTPFALTGSATDADGDPLTYCWEQNDNATSAQANAASVASATKASGPNWISFSPTTGGTRIFPKLATILAGNLISGPLTGGDANANTEALSSVARTLNFRLTVRDNAPYSSTTPVSVGQTQFADVAITVSATSGPFAVTVPNTAVTWAGGSTQTVTWSVANTTAAPVSCANVKISLSIDGGFTWPYVLAASTANDGSESITVPSIATTTARVKIESVGNIFFDISNANFTITNNACAASVTAQPAATSVCPNSTATFSVTGSGTSLTYQWQVSTDGGANFSNVSGATSATYSFTATTAQNGAQYRCVLTGGCGAPVNSAAATLSVTGATTVTTQPAATSACSGASATFSTAANGGGLTYQWQVSTNGGSTYTNVAGATAATYTFTTASAQNGNLYRCVISSSCTAPVNTTGAQLTVTVATVVTANPTNVTLCSGSNASFSTAATGNALGYQWQVSTDGGSTFNNVANTGVYSGATTATLSLTAVTNTYNNYRYRCVVSSACAALNSTAALLTVNTAPAISSSPAASVICGGQGTGFSLSATGTAITYQWQVSTDNGATYTNIGNTGNYSGTTTPSLGINPADTLQNGYQYRCIVNGTCAPAATSAVRLLTVNKPITIRSQPRDTALCAGSSTTLTVVAGGTTPSYQWQLTTDGGSTYSDVSGATSASLTLNNLNTSSNGYQYRCMVSGAAPCGPVASGTARITVNPIPVVSLGASPYLHLVPGLSTTLTAVSNPGNVTYAWYYNGLLQSGVTATHQVVNIDKLGVYAVKATDAIGCTARSADLTISDSVSQLLFIYPNPNSGIFQVRFYNPNGHVARNLRIYDAKGSLIYERTFTIDGLYDRMDVNIAHAAPGVYFVGLYDGTGKRIAQGKVQLH